MHNNTQSINCPIGKRNQMMRKPIHCEDKHDYYNIIPPFHHTNTNQHRTHREPREQQYEEESKWDHLEPAGCTGDTGYSGSGASYIKLPIYAQCHPPKVSSHSHNTESGKSSLPFLSFCSFCSTTLSRNEYLFSSIMSQVCHCTQRLLWKDLRGELPTTRDHPQNK